jgi:cbb3-type cytochrome c oxidase subunit III
MRKAAAAALAGVAALLAAGCGTSGLSGGNSDVSAGKQLFSQNCSSCHALADAGAKGTIGPNLDDAFKFSRDQGFAESTIRNVVRQQIDLAEPPMPADLVKGEDADAVAAYVARVAGKPVKGGGGKVTTKAGKEIFAQAGCSSCHTLKDAGSTGTIGPNLDEAKPSVELAIDRVTNGKPPMPSFKGQLSTEQIRAVAMYVHDVAGK